MNPTGTLGSEKRRLTVPGTRGIVAGTEESAAMPRETLTITLDRDRKADLDRLAQTQGRNRDTLIDEALEARLDLQDWQTREIRAGLEDAAAGNVAAEAEIPAAFGHP